MAEGTTFGIARARSGRIGKRHRETQVPGHDLIVQNGDGDGFEQFAAGKAQRVAHREIVGVGKGRAIGG